MTDKFLRTRLLLGDEGQSKLKRASVALFGLGGVGSWCAEALVRSGIGNITLIDDDTVSVTNINRQLMALGSTVGMKKTRVMRERISDINPDCKVEAADIFYCAETENELDLTGFSYIVDAVDTVSAKLILAERAPALGVPIISCMGAGNRLDPSAFKVADIYDTDICPLARIMRKELRKRGVKSLKVVYSREKALTPWQPDDDSAPAPEDSQRPGKPAIRPVPGSIAFVPAAAGLLMAAEVVKDILGM